MTFTAHYTKLNPLNQHHRCSMISMIICHDLLASRKQSQHLNGQVPASQACDQVPVLEHCLAFMAMIQTVSAIWSGSLLLPFAIMLL